MIRHYFIKPATKNKLRISQPSISSAQHRSQPPTNFTHPTNPLPPIRLINCLPCPYPPPPPPLKKLIQKPRIHPPNNQAIQLPLPSPKLPRFPSPPQHLINPISTCLIQPLPNLTILYQACGGTRDVRHGETIRVVVVVPPLDVGL